MPTAVRSHQRAWEAGLVTVLVVVAAGVYTKDIAVGGLRWSDSCSRAMDGVLIHDWVLSGPRAWTDPVGFARRQYAHYPTLSIGRVYPPGFAVVESVFFAVFGTSSFSARLCTVCFGLLAVVGCYTLARTFMAPLASACATGFLIGMPGVVYWTRMAMLEMPALAVLIWTGYAARKYIEKPTWGRGACVAFLTLASVCVKQTAVFIVPVLGVLFAWRAFGRRTQQTGGTDARIPPRHIVVAALTVLLPLAAYFMYTFFSGGRTTYMFDVVTMDKPIGTWLSWESLSFYPRTLPRRVGWPLLILAAVGLSTKLWRRRHDRWGDATHRDAAGWSWAFVALWFVVYYLMTALIQYKEDRYFFFNYFPIALWAGCGAAAMLGVIRPARIRPVVAAALVVVVVTTGHRTPLRYEPDYDPLVARYESQIRGHVVLFEGLRDGDFTFAARRRLGPEGCVIIRGSKVFYSCPAIDWFDYRSNVSSTADVARIIDAFAFNLIFVERRNPLHLKEVDLLHEELADRRRYKLVGSHVLTVDRPNQSRRTRVVDVFRPVHRSARRVRFLEIPIPIDGRTLRVDLDELLPPEA